MCVYMCVCVCECECVWSRPTSLWRCGRQQSWPGAQRAPACGLRSLAAGQEDVAAGEAQVLVHLAGKSLLPEVQTEGAAAAALLQGGGA